MKVQLNRGARYLLLTSQVPPEWTMTGVSYPHVEARGQGVFMGFWGLVSYLRGQSPYDGRPGSWVMSTTGQWFDPSGEVEFGPEVLAVEELFLAPTAPAVPSLPGQPDAAPRSHFWGGVALVSLGLFLLSRPS